MKILILSVNIEYPGFLLFDDPPCLNFCALLFAYLSCEALLCRDSNFPKK
jgi:hypothetical protein